MEKIVMYSMTRSGHNFIKQNILSWKKRGFVNLESEYPRAYKKHIERYLKVNDKPINVIVQRDLLSWLASYLKARINKRHVKPITYRVDEFINTWGEIMKEYAGVTNYVPNKTIISYESFKNNKKYRQSICKALGGTYNESKLNEIPPNGQYSSFNGQMFQNKGTKMKTESRYKFFLNSEYEDVYFDFLKKHPDVVDLYLEHYYDNDKEKQELILDKL